MLPTVPTKKAAGQSNVLGVANPLGMIPVAQPLGCRFESSSGSQFFYFNESLLECRRNLSVQTSLTPVSADSGFLPVD